MTPFRLAGLGRLRQLQEDQAAAELARRSARSRQARHHSQVAVAQLAGAVLPEQADVLTWRASVAARAAASAVASEAHTVTEITASQEQQAQAQWSVARTRTTTIDKLAQRHVLAERENELRLEQHTLDELATQRAVDQATELS